MYFSESSAAKFSISFESRLSNFTEIVCFFEKLKLNGICFLVTSELNLVDFISCIGITPIEGKLFIICLLFSNAFN